MSLPSEYNPFEAPLEASNVVDLSPVGEWRQLLRQFRQQSDGLAGAALFLAVCTGIVAFLILSEDRGPYLFASAGIGALASVALSVAGVQIAIKNTLGVRILMFPAYVGLLVAGLSIPSTCGFTIPVAVCFGLLAAQCHRVLRMSKRLTSAGIPLNTKPHELATEYFRQLLSGVDDHGS